MTIAGRRSANEQVVGRHAGIGEPVQQAGEDSLVVVDSSEDRGLVCCYDTREPEKIEGLECFLCELARVVEMGNNVNLAILEAVLGQDGKQFGVVQDPERIEGHRFAFYTNYPHVLYGA
jgi:hypothetical protein